MKIKPIISLLLVAVLLVGGTGCAQIKDDIYSVISPSRAEQERFDDYLADVFGEVAGANFLDSRFILENPSNFGIKDIPLTVGKIDFELLDEPMKDWQEEYDELTAFDYEKLTADRQLSYDILSHEMNRIKLKMGFEYYSEISSPLKGVQSQLPSLLCEVKLYTLKDAYDYLTMLKSVPAYFDDILKFQQRKSEKGLFMSDAQLDVTIESCNNFIDGYEDHPLITDFASRISNLPTITEEDIIKLEELNKSVVEEKIIPAYEDFVRGISALRGTGRSGGGLCFLSEGKKYYELLAQDLTGLDCSVPQMSEMIDEEIGRITKIANKTFKSDSTVHERLEKVELNIQDPMEIIELLKERSSDYFPPLQNLEYQVKYIDPDMEDHSSPAFFIVPQIDSTKTNTIYINRKYTQDKIYLFTTLAHEGYPGHMYQINYFNSLNPSPIRRLMDFPGYSEGWATYMEMLSYDFMDLKDPNVTQMMQLNNCLSMMVACRVDIGVNYEGWSIEDTQKYLSTYSDADMEMSKLFYNSVIEEPGSDLSYGIGFLEFKKLRLYAQSELKDDFSNVDFHKAVLNIGPAPFYIVSQEVTDYVSEAKAKAHHSIFNKAA
ncbi:MAG: DUF885 domain-containing protein [Oscillospiraceae bacterium]